MSQTRLLVLSLICPLACFQPGDDDEAGDEIESSDSEDTSDTTSDDSTDATTDTTQETTDETTDTTDTETGPPPDSDMDGIDDVADNCPGDPNPNQLDFDGDGEGNVCDVLVFTDVNGTLSSMFVADAGIGGMCESPIDFIATGGSVRVALDDDAQLVRIELTEVITADILDVPCQLFFDTQVSIHDFTMANGDQPFPVSTAHSQAAHDAGTAMGLTNVPHPVLATGDMEVSVDGGTPQASPLQLMDASLPPMLVQIDQAGASMTLGWMAPNYVIGTTQYMVDEPIMITVDVQFVGVDGSLTLAP